MLKSNICRSFSGRLVFCMAGVLLIVNSAAGFSGNGSGTSAGDPFQVTTCLELQEMLDDLDAYYRLENDIDCADTMNWNSGAGFEPVGTLATPFQGTLDGQNFTISDLFINRPTVAYVGLTGRVVAAAFSNINFENVTLTGDYYVGAVAGLATSSTTITNVHSSGSVVAEGGGGGAVGGLNGSITRSSSSVTVTASSSAGQWFGGLVGSQGAEITDCFATGDIVADGNQEVGGLIGNGWSTIVRSYAAGAVQAAGSSDKVGGLVGFMESNQSIQGSFSVSPVAGGSGANGGLVGVNQNNIPLSVVQNCYFDETQTTLSTCVGQNGLGTGGSCTGVNSGGSPNATYFVGNSTNPPFDTWDFRDVWQVCAGSEPKLQGQCTAAISAASVTPESLIVSATGSVNVQLTPTNILADDGTVIVIFPDGFEIDSGGITSAGDLINIDGNLSASASGRTLTLIRSGGTDIAGGTPLSFSLSNIRNPSTAGTTGAFTLQTANASSAVLDENNAVPPVTFACASGTFGNSCTACPGGAGESACSERGECDDGATGSGSCSCAQGYAGEDCAACSAGHFGTGCSECPGDGNCSGHGTCDDGVTGSGACECDENYTGAECARMIVGEGPGVSVRKRRKDRVIASCSLPSGVDTAVQYRYVVKNVRTGQRYRKQRRRRKARFSLPAGRYKMGCRYIGANKKKSRFSTRVKFRIQ